MRSHLLLCCGLAACAPDLAVVQVHVDDLDEVAAVGISDADVWNSGVDDPEALSELREGPSLPARFEVPAGRYVVYAAQGTANEDKEVEVDAGDTLDVYLALVPVE